MRKLKVGDLVCWKCNHKPILRNFTVGVVVEEEPHGSFAVFWLFDEDINDYGSWNSNGETSKDNFQGSSIVLFEKRRWR